MIRGKTLFKCDKCGKIFLGVDIEYMATSLSQPIECPGCGSFHTYPVASFLMKSVYKEIWAKIFVWRKTDQTCTFLW